MSRYDVCSVSGNECYLLGRCNLNPDDCVYLDDQNVVLGGQLFEVDENGYVRYGNQNLGRLSPLRIRRSESILAGTLWGL